MNVLCMRCSTQGSVHAVPKGRLCARGAVHKAQCMRCRNEGSAHRRVEAGAPSVRKAYCAHLGVRGWHRCPHCRCLRACLSWPPLQPLCLLKTKSPFCASPHGPRLGNCCGRVGKQLLADAIRTEALHVGVSSREVYSDQSRVTSVTT
ncbi:hypothetical protein NDU88_007690 [Pleurodeles waltl]|uniref:Uncharacterized protein n=1 Tax=Pleurodeles waltl TaxID=8319 RepID=A0AAV7U0U3_PLEWA|nr:hypothetical protein NDU88_007690 [Pleurodeles waltl]